MSPGIRREYLRLRAKDYRTSKRDTWETADSIWGIIGDDWRDSGYDVDIREGALAALDAAFQREAEALEGRRATYAAADFSSTHR